MLYVSSEQDRLSFGLVLGSLGATLLFVKRSSDSELAHEHSLVALTVAGELIGSDEDEADKKLSTSLLIGYNVNISVVVCSFYWEIH